MEDFKEFYVEIEVDLIELDKRKQQIKQKFIDKVKGFENKNWFLTHDIDLYLRCFYSVDKERLQTLMREDLQKWKRELQEAKNNGEQLKLEVQALLWQQKQQLADLLNNSKLKAP